MKPWVISLAVTVLGTAVLVNEGRAQSYGSESQVLTIGAAEFRARITSDTYIDADGYLYQDGDIDNWAPLSLPEGALIEKICLYANDSDPAAFVETYIFAAKLVATGEDPAFQIAGSEVTTSSDVGYGVYCSSSFAYTARGRIDIDGDGSDDPVAYYVYALVPSASQNSLGFGAVQITWKRQLSPSPQAPTFGDVPSDDPAFSFIEALAASGITAGCAGGNYCPDATLTRRQMAVFLAKALGLHWAD